MTHDHGNSTKHFNSIFVEMPEANHSTHHIIKQISIGISFGYLSSCLHLKTQLFHQQIYSLAQNYTNKILLVTLFFQPYPKGHGMHGLMSELDLE